MIRRSTLAALVATIVVAPLAHPGAGAQAATRAIRRDIPLTNTIRHALAAGTRDSTGRPGRKYWQLWMDYTINVSLDPATSTISGRETIKLHNNSDTSLSSIQLRLDQNIFRGENPRGASVPAENHDGFVITDLKVDGSAVAIAAQPVGRGRGAAPASGGPSISGARTTSARLNLASPIAPRGVATLEIEWHNKLAGGPGAGHRMTLRWGDSLYQAAQWYPRVAVFDDLRGWDTEPYLGPAEFYNNFGRFDVSIDVPSGWIVGATGVLQNPTQVLSTTARERLSHVLESDSTRTIVGAEETLASPTAGDRQVWHFVADTVNDFAWATARHWVWQATRATIPGRGPIPVNVYYLPGRAAQFANSGPILRHALEFYSKLWMPDAFPQHTMVDGPDNGMEYPMLVMSNDGPADHETGHQWWPMMVSNNETWYGWMDEGFNQYMNILSAADASHRPPDLDGLGQSYGRTSGDEREGSLMWNENFGGPLYSFQAYSKTPLMLSMLGAIVGDSAVWRAQSEYAKAWRFKHPSPWDYAFFMSNALHRDLGWFWYYWLFTTESVDGSIQNVTTNGAHTIVTVKQDGQMPSPIVLKLQLAPGGAPIKAPANATVTGDTVVVTYPVDVWFNSVSKTFKADIQLGGRKVEKVTLDPHCRFPDRDPSDNVWPRASASATGDTRGQGRGRASCG